MVNKIIGKPGAPAIIESRVKTPVGTVLPRLEQAPAIMKLAEGFQQHQGQLDGLVKQLQSKRQ
jgi:hypothetical protein